MGVAEFAGKTKQLAAQKLDAQAAADYSFHGFRTPALSDYPEKYGGRDLHQTFT